MISKKEQNIVDAVDALRGNYLYQDGDVFLNQIANGNYTSTVRRYKGTICTIEEFKQCVKEMSEHNGSDPEYYSEWNKPILSKENSDYSFYDNSPTSVNCKSMNPNAFGVDLSKEDKMKNIYTQEMFNNEESPEVGMLVDIKDTILGSIEPDAKLMFLSDHHVVYTHNGNEYADSLKHYQVLPPDQRTPEQRQLDSIYKRSLEKGYHVNKLYLKFLQEQGYFLPVDKG